MRVRLQRSWQKPLPAPRTPHLPLTHPHLPLTHSSHTLTFPSHAPTGGTRGQSSAPAPSEGGGQQWGGGRFPFRFCLMTYAVTAACYAAISIIHLPCFPLQPPLSPAPSHTGRSSLVDHSQHTAPQFTTYSSPTYLALPIPLTPPLHPPSPPAPSHTGMAGRSWWCCNR